MTEEYCHISFEPHIPLSTIINSLARSYAEVTEGPEEAAVYMTVCHMARAIADSELPDSTLAERDELVAQFKKDVFYHD